MSQNAQNQSVTLRPQQDNQRPGERIAWAADGGLVHLPPGITYAHSSVRVVITPTGRRLGNGKPVYTATQAPDEVLQERYHVDENKKTGGPAELVCTTVVTTWLGERETRETRRPCATQDGKRRQRTVYRLAENGTTVVQIQQTFIPLLREGVFRDGKVAFGTARRPLEPGEQFTYFCRPLMGRWEPETELARFPLGSVFATRVQWPMTSGRIPVKIPADTQVEVFTTNPNGKVVGADTTWGALSADTRQQLLVRYPACPQCSKWRVDTTRGFNVCGKCLDLDGYAQAILPFLCTLDPQVTISPDPTGKSLQFRFGDEKVSHRFRNGYGFEWDDAAQCLRAGKANMGKVWDKLRPIPHEAMQDASPVLALLGLTIAANPKEPREVFVQGDWVNALDARARKALGLKGKKGAYTLHGVEVLDDFIGMLLNALRGDRVLFKIQK